MLEVGIVGAKVLFLHFMPGTLTQSDTQNFTAPGFYRFDVNKPWQLDEPSPNRSPKKPDLRLGRELAKCFRPPKPWNGLWLMDSVALILMERIAMPQYDIVGNSNI